MKKIDYIVIGVCISVVVAFGICMLIINKEKVNEAVDKYRVVQLKVQHEALQHAIDSVARILKAENMSILTEHARVIQQRDSLQSILDKKLTLVQYVYIEKTNALVGLPGDSLVSILSGQLSGAHR